MKKSIVILTHPLGRKVEAEEAKKNIEEGDNNFVVVLIDESMQVEVLPSLY